MVASRSTLSQSAQRSASAASRPGTPPAQQGCAGRPLLDRTSAMIACPLKEDLQDLTEFPRASHTFKRLVSNPTSNPVTLRFEIADLTKDLVLKGCAFKVDLDLPPRIVQASYLHAVAVFPVAVALRFVPSLKLANVVFHSSLLAGNVLHHLRTDLARPWPGHGSQKRRPGSPRAERAGEPGAALSGC